MKRFEIDELAQKEFDEATAWYESQREGLGLEFVLEIDRVLERIENADKLALAPVAVLDVGVIRREFVHRFPYVVIFVETDAMRRVIMIRNASSDPARWRSRV